MKNSFIVYTDNIEYLDELTDEQVGKLYKAQIRYSRGDEPDIDDSMVRIAFKVIKGQMDRDSEKYQKKVENMNRNRSEISMKSERNHNEIVSDTVTDTVTDTVNKEKDSKESKKKSNSFKPPTVDEVKKYCDERNNGINPIQFVDYYQANGWIRGKTKIKDWKACVRTWEQRDRAAPTSVKEKEIKKGIQRNENLDAWLNTQVKRRIT